MEEAEEARPLTYDQAEPLKGRNVGRTITIILVVVVILAIIGAALYGMVSYPLVTEVIRDIAIIVLALVTIVIGLFLAVLIFQLQSLIALLRNEIKPILDSANDTVSTVRGTTSFVSDNVVSPMIRFMSFAAGVGQTARVLVRGPSRSSGRRDGNRRAS